MTMYTLPNFCRVCLKYDKNLIDLEHIENEPNETLMSKLMQCVSEVDWRLFKPLLCHPCIKRLNTAYTFKKQCVQSATMLKSYLTLLSKNKSENEEKVESNTYMMLPNQTYIKIVVNPQNQTGFQNVAFNVVPTTITTDSKNKDTNQNVFINFTNMLHKPEDTNVNELLTDSKSEELSVEIDPTDLGLPDGGNSEDENQDNGVNDWEDVISATKIASKNGAINGAETKYVPILPKQSDDSFSNSGEHFLLSQFSGLDFTCEECSKQFGSKLALRNHIKCFHMGKFPFSCDYCSTNFMVREEYEACVKCHKEEQSYNSLTLNDFKQEAEEEVEPTELNCDICHRQFNSPSGLLRHKVRKHNQKSKKKYFIKGMKNAKCDICNREFSTQSYMQLHRKLHLRDDIGYKYKVFGKHRYVKSDEQKSEPKEEKNDNQGDCNKDEEMDEVEEEDDQNSNSGSEN